LIERVFEDLWFSVKILESPQVEAAMKDRTPDWPDPVPYADLSERQQEILRFAWNYPHPYPPSFREIGVAVGLRGLAAVSYQLSELQRKGWTRRDPRHARALAVRRSDGRLPVGLESPRADRVRVPRRGLIHAGPFSEALRVDEGAWELPQELVGRGEVFILQVRGDSMIDAAIVDRDWVAVRRQATAEDGEIVVAMIDDEATLKTLRRANGRVLLMPQNPRYLPIPAENATILGKVVAVLRRI
jgi:repressor LexA